MSNTKSGFVHLHVHGEYSLLDGMSKIPDLVKKIKDSGMTACALTDHGVMNGVVDFYNECRKQGIKPILGCECYEAPESRLDKNSHAGEERYHHLILLVKNETGYKNLCHLVSRSNIDGFYYKPRIDFELLEQYHEGLICLSACLAGRVPREILRGISCGDMEPAKKAILRYRELFGDDYYLEIQNHGIREEQIVANELVRFSDELGIKLVCTNDCHYTNSEDKEAHEYLLCLQTKKTLDSPDRLVYEGDYSVKTEEEMRQLFPSLPQAFDNTLEVADKCNFDFKFGDYRMPKVVIPKEYGNDYFRYLEDESWKGWEKRYPVGNRERETAKKDLEYELGIVKQMGFAEYFLDTRKTIRWSREHGILVGPGRGSAAGSRMCYCLGITDIDPIPYNLLFERFLNPERISMPDIDVDYNYSYKDDVIAFEAESNGWDHFAKIRTFTAMNAKGIVRDIARVAGYPVAVGDRIAGLIPGSRMCYCLGITDIDPIPYNLLFERFLNPERISMPDIDVDYNYSYKDDVIAFEAESNGWDHFAKIRTFTAMNAKGIVRDIARVAGYPVAVGDRIAGLIPKDPKMTLDKAWDSNPDLQNFINSDPGYQKLWKIARRLEGTKKAASTHACGHIPTPVPCEDLFPVSVDPETGYLVCQYNMTDAEHLGNLKKDLLMLRNLTIIDTAQKSVKEKYGVEIPLWTEEILNDKEALKLISSGDTNGVFQLESEGMKGFMKKLQPTCFEDIIAGVALYRPGPMEYIDDYIRGKHDPGSIKYLTPELESILSSTYGVIVYQEQVMQIVQKLAGFSMGRADLIRKAMGKKKQDIMDQEAPRFIYGDKELKIDGCVNRGIPEETAKQIWEQMVDFAKYAFNKSHAAAYAAIAMQTAYLKAHYALEFAAGLLTSVMDKTDKLAVYIAEYRKNGIRILSPDINLCHEDFTVVGDSIYYGLAALKNVGKEAIGKVIDERKTNGQYVSFYDLVKRNPEIDKKMLEALAKTGALDFTGYTRHTLMISGVEYLSAQKRASKKQIEGQLSLMDLFGSSSDMTDTLSELPEYSEEELLFYEKEGAGVYISKHPIDVYAEVLSKNPVKYSSYLYADEETGAIPAKEKEEVSIAGIIRSYKVIYTKKNNEPMVFLDVEDSIGVTKVVVFHSLYELINEKIREDRPVFIRGKVSIREEEASLIADSVFFLDEPNYRIWIRFDSIREFRNNESVLEKISSWNRGMSLVSVLLNDKRITMALKIHMSSDQKAINELKEAFGEMNVLVKETQYL